MAKSRKNNDPYRVVRRIDWIRKTLEQGKPVNAPIVQESFHVSARTVMRDIQYLKKYYGRKIVYDYGDRAFCLEV